VDRSRATLRTDENPQPRSETLAVRSHRRVEESLAKREGSPISPTEGERFYRATRRKVALPLLAESLFPERLGFPSPRERRAAPVETK
jgi:hypothetical protein